MIISIVLTAAQAGAEDEPRYAYDRYGEILGYQTDNYLFNLRDGQTWYKVESEDGATVYTYSPSGDLISYQKKERYPVILHDIRRAIFSYYYVQKKFMLDKTR
jgi:hypothetical protein